MPQAELGFFGGRPCLHASNTAAGERRTVRTYRLFFFDAADHIRHWVALECEDDDAAARAAGEQADGRAMELWLRDRLVRRFPGDPEQRPRPPVRAQG